MATSSEVRACQLCSKHEGQVICNGCQQAFCITHFREHRKKLFLIMDYLTDEHNQLQENLLENDDDQQQHPLMIRVDQWEKKSIEKVKQVANDVRKQLQISLNRSKKNIEKSLCNIAEEIRENRSTEAFTEIDLSSWMKQLKRLAKQLENPPQIKMKHDQDEASETHLPLVQLKLISQSKVPGNISNETYWVMNGQTVAGGHGPGNSLHQLNYPIGLDVDDDGTLFVADTNNHRIVRWKRHSKQGQIIIGGKEPGNQTNQLMEPLAVVIDRINDCLLISEEKKRRVMRWSLVNNQRKDPKGELIISNIYSLGLAIDNEGLLYVSDYERHEVRRYGPHDGRKGIIVAGGNEQGDGLDQLHHPRHIYVDEDNSVFVSDCHNHRVMKWIKNAKEGIVVAGGQEQGNSLRQLSSPSGIFVDRTRSVYVVDQENHRVMRWSKGANEGEVILGENDRDSQNNQFNQPTSISFDDQGNLYVGDYLNHRIQQFKIQ